VRLRIAIDVRHARDFGFGTYIRNLIQAMARIETREEFLLIGREPDFQAFGPLPANFALHRYEREDSGFENQWRLPLLVRNLRPNLTHIPLNAVPLCLPRPYVVTIHDMSSVLFSGGGDARQQFQMFKVRRGLERANRILTVSSATQRDVQTLLDIPAGRIRQIYNAPDPRFLAAAPTAEERRLVLDRYQVTYPYLLYAGTIRPQKNIPRLIEAFAVLRGELAEHPRFKDLRLVIIGDELSRYPAVRRAVIQTRCEPWVRFLGFVPLDVLRVFYAATEVFCFPSLYEGFGLPPLEAMAAGAPVVTSNVTSLPEVVGQAAEIVNPENVFDIARGIREVLLDPERRALLVRSGREQASHFSWEKTAAEVLAVYREVARP
jgi:glycosyltransferase involved in cell wall biosynthesis